MTHNSRRGRAATSVPDALDVVGRALSVAREHGNSAAAFQGISWRYEHFFDGDAYVAYVDTRTAWVAAGAPVCAPSRAESVTKAFAEAARRAERRAVFFGVARPFCETFRFVPIGEEPAWDPRVWAESLRSHESLREQLRRARAKGVVVSEIEPSNMNEHSFRAPIARLVERWNATRSMAPMDFVVKLEPFELLEERRTFVAHLRGEIVGFASLLPIPARAGWFVEHLIRSPDAPNGTSETLVDAAMRAVCASGAEYVTLGLAPLAGDVPAWLRPLRERARFLYDFEGVHGFKAKFRPTDWNCVGVAFPTDQSEFTSVLEVLRAFAGGGVVAFGVRSLLRRVSRSRIRRELVSDGHHAHEA